MKVLVTGGAGQIAYSLIPLLLSGQVFGTNKKITLKLLDIEPCFERLQGVEMEIHDSNFPCLEELVITTELQTAFHDIDIAILLGGFPRLPNMERKDLLAKNFTIFRAHGQALEKYAKPSTRVLVIANPANTNCWIANVHAPSIPPSHFTSLSFLDQERLVHLLKSKYAATQEQTQNALIWGNHSSTMVADASQTPQQLRLEEKDKTYIQQRGADVIQKRGSSSAMSAANAIQNHLKTWCSSGEDASMVSFGVYNEEGHYGFAKDLFISLPVVITRPLEYRVVSNLELGLEEKAAIQSSIQELVEEREEVKLLLQNVLE
jgi:malate dehydrogenase